MKFIDSGMTRNLQFLDVHFNKPFKDVLKFLWKEWNYHGKKEFISIVKRTCASFMESS